MALKLYTNHFSQPARAVTLFVRAAKIPAEEIFVAIDQGEQSTDEFYQVTKFRKVPAIVHNEFHLSESVSILRYLAREFKVADHWYPQRDNQAMARIDQFLGWQHLGLRMPLDRFLLSSIYPDWHVITDYPTPPSDLQRSLNKNNMINALNNFVKLWLNDGSNKFVTGDQISIADLIAIAEIEIMKMTEYNVRDSQPKVDAYLDRVRTTLQPHYDQVHEILWKAAEERVASNDK